MRGQYWFKQDEDNIINYIQGKERNYKPVYESFDKLIGRILSKKQFSNMDVNTRDELHSDIHVHLYDKIDNFDLSKSNGNHPVYSYFSHLIFCEVYKRFNKNEISTISYDYGYSVISEDYIDDLEYKELVEERLLDISIIVDKLNDHQKVLYKLYFIDDLDMKEIACQLEVSNMFVFQQLRDLRIEIRNQLGITGELPKIRQRGNKKRLS